MKFNYDNMLIHFNGGFGLMDFKYRTKQRKNLKHIHIALVHNALKVLLKNFKSNEGSGASCCFISWQLRLDFKINMLFMVVMNEI